METNPYIKTTIYIISQFQTISKINATERETSVFLPVCLQIVACCSIDSAQTLHAIKVNSVMKC